MSNLINKTVKELIDLCKSKSISGYSGKKKAEIIDLILKSTSYDISFDDLKVSSHTISIDDSKETSSNKHTSDLIDLYNNKNYNKCMKHAENYENSEINKYYEKVLCLKNVQNTKPRKDTIEEAYNKIKHKIKNKLEEVLDKAHYKLCVLPKNHSGDCDHNPIVSLLKNNKTTEKIKNKIVTAVYSVPGNDGYIYKNRAPRNFPIMIDSETERKLSNKNQKLKCAIPLSEYGTPNMLAASYLDFIVLILNIRGTKDHIKEGKTYDLYKSLLVSHTKFMKEFFEKKKRNIFNKDGYLICPILKNEFNIDNLVQSDRDSRIDLNENDIQLGHIVSRADNEWTIRGMNVSLMSRRGNQIIGEYNLFENEWIEQLKKVIYGY